MTQPDHAITVRMEAREFATFAAILSRSTDPAIRAVAPKLHARAKAFRGHGRMAIPNDVDAWTSVVGAASGLMRRGTEASLVREIHRQVIEAQRVLSQPDVRVDKANRLWMKRRRQELAAELAAGAFDECGPFLR